ncbi:gamma-glutamyl-gamma-aminobutyrate hydrolase family protein [Streptomyces sp. NBC_00285]|uniref:gamma-glutamyl-gamma-aminobutyrate hydrolase family protein n=1 Tax=Streptomyces sp. NBC_00285 TaxID=2975700 RepID=UPI002E29944D|nr:gamma-glutamyl-gamma-aminobutyrate hydrolase family protein [Streptomyces sp. NBC_00285]
MTNRPLVALACATETWDGVPHAAVRRAYITALEEVAHCSVVLLPGPGPLPDELLARCDGLVLGGHESNVAPERYGGAPCPGPFDPDRDALALPAVRRAVAVGLPLLGICRGLQEINVAYGGTLRALDCADHREDPTLSRDEQYRPAHEVTLAHDGLLRRLLDGADRARVNSLHGQAVGTLAPGLRSEATAPDGVIEALSVVGARTFALGVQWHPEWYAATDPVCRRLFESFGAAAARRASGRAEQWTNHLVGHGGGAR